MDRTLDGSRQAGGLRMPGTESRITWIPQASSEIEGFRLCVCWCYSRSSGYAVGRGSGKKIRGRSRERHGGEMGSGSGVITAGAAASVGVPGRER